jgi:hypothetical protein
MTVELKPVTPPVIGPTRTDADREAALRTLERAVRDLTDRLNEVIKRLP